MESCRFYYNTFDSSRGDLSALYVRPRRLGLHEALQLTDCMAQRDHSMLTFEQEQFQGASGIIEKLKVRTTPTRL